MASSDASVDAAEVQTLFERYRAPLIGVATGQVSGIDVLDLDAKSGGAAWWRAHSAQLMPTRTHRTLSGGLHFVFQHAPGLRNSAGRLAPGCEVRADGGDVLWWPAAGFPVLSDAQAAAWPDWLLHALQASSMPSVPCPASALPGSCDAGGRRYAVGALRHAVRLIAAAPEGARNDVLNREAFGLARFISLGLLSAVDIVGSLAIAAQTAGLPAAETERTITSALRAGHTQ